jgi:hypothetical protein
MIVFPRDLLLLQWPRGRDRIVVGITAACTITANAVSSNPVHGEVYSIQHYVINL